VGLAPHFSEILKKKISMGISMAWQATLVSGALCAPLIPTFVLANWAV